MEIKTHTLTYIVHKTRKAQNYVQTYHLIYNSIRKIPTPEDCGGITQIHRELYTCGWSIIQITYKKVSNRHHVHCLSP